MRWIMALLAVPAAAGCAATPSSTATPGQMARSVNACLQKHGATSVKRTSIGWQAAFPHGAVAYRFVAGSTSGTQGGHRVTGFAWSAEGTLGRDAMTTCTKDLQR
jgi:hypothetical protein